MEEVCQRKRNQWPEMTETICGHSAEHKCELCHKVFCTDYMYIVCKICHLFVTCFSCGFSVKDKMTKCSKHIDETEVKCEEPRCCCNK